MWFDSPVKAVYRGDPEQTAAITHPAGWQTLGDVGYVDDDGYLFLTDRWTHKIVTGGVNVFPREVEDVLLAHPQGARRRGHRRARRRDGRVGARRRGTRLVGRRRPALADELIAWTAARLAHYKCPRAVDFELNLPRGENGKLYKRVLRDRYWAGRTSRIL